MTRRGRARARVRVTASMTSASVSAPYVCGSRVPRAPRFGPKRNRIFMPSLPSRQYPSEHVVGDVVHDHRSPDVLAGARSEHDLELLVEPERLEDLVGTGQRAVGSPERREDGPCGWRGPRARPAGFCEPGREHHADPTASPCPPSEPIESLECVAERVPVVQDRARRRRVRPPPPSAPSRDAAGHQPLRVAGSRSRIGAGHAPAVQEPEVQREPVLRDLREPPAELALGQACAACRRRRPPARLQNVPTRFLPSEVDSALPPIAASTCARSVVGTWMNGTPRMYVEATNPARSPTAPRPARPPGRPGAPPAWRADAARSRRPVTSWPLRPSAR